MFTQFATDTPREVKIFLAVWMTFWGYFEYKVFHILWWKVAGYEKLIFKDNQMILQIYSGKKNNEIEMNSTEVSDIKLVDFSKRKYRRELNSTFFGLGNETILFSVNKTQMAIGRQLNEAAASKILKEIKNRIRI